MTEVGERVNDTRGQEEYLDNGTILYVDCGTDYTTIFFCQNSVQDPPPLDRVNIPLLSSHSMACFCHHFIIMEFSSAHRSTLPLKF